MSDDGADMGITADRAPLSRLLSPSFGYLQWLAGILDGEGSFAVVGKGRWPRICMNSTDQDVVRHIAFLAGCGNVRGPVQRQAHHKPFWVWTVGKQDHIRALGRALLPLMSARRQAQIRKMLAASTAHSPSLKTVCDNGHSLRDALIRPNGTRKCRQCNAAQGKKVYQRFRQQHIASGSQESLNHAWNHRNDA